MSVRSVALLLSRIPLLEGSDPAHLQMLAFASGRAKYEKGATIIEAGQHSNAACLILSGEAEIFTGGRAVARAKTGALLGELTMIADSAYAISAVATEPVAVALISRDVFMRVASEFPEFGARVHKALAAKFDGSIGDLTRLHDLFAKKG
jgi:CRP/FNR family transcriptional regulator, cyclic AMP receptor protein